MGKVKKPRPLPATLSTLNGSTTYSRSTQTNTVAIAPKPKSKAETISLNARVIRDNGPDILSTLPTTLEPVIIPRKTFNTIKKSSVIAQGDSPLFNLPSEIFIELFNSLPTDSACNLAQTCKFAMHTALEHGIIVFEISTNNSKTMMQKADNDYLEPRSKRIKLTQPSAAPRPAPRPCKALLSVRIADSWTANHIILGCARCPNGNSSTKICDFSSGAFEQFQSHLSAHRIASNAKILRLAAICALRRFLKDDGAGLVLGNARAWNALRSTRVWAAIVERAVSDVENGVDDDEESEVDSEGIWRDFPWARMPSTF